MAGGLFVLPKMHKITQNSLLKKHGIFCLTFRLEKFLEKTVAIPVFLCYTILAFIRRGGLLRRLIQNEKEVNTP